MISNANNATTQDGESDALLKMRRGVNIYDGLNDHDGRLWHLFKEELATAIKERNEAQNQAKEQKQKVKASVEEEDRSF